MFSLRNAFKVVIQNVSINASNTRAITQRINHPASILQTVKSFVDPQRDFGSITKSWNSFGMGSNPSSCGVLHFSHELLTKTNDVSLLQKRTVTKYSFTRGKRRTVRPVLKRFFRLNWGIWIRTKCGRHKRLYKKSSARKRRLRQHVFCNASQSYLLDKMVNRFWKVPKYYVDDPYEPYHQREEFPVTRRTPKPPTIA